MNGSATLRILSIETSSRFPSVAIIEANFDAKLTAQELFLANHAENNASKTKFDVLAIQEQIGAEQSQTSSNSLIPAIQWALDNSGYKLNEIDLITLPRGPGSFTGLRMGIVTAKTIAYTTNCNVIGVNTMEVIAWQAKKSIVNAQSESNDSTVSVGMNVGRKEVYHAEFNWKNESLNLISDPVISAPEKWLKSLASDVWLAGSGIGLFNSPNDFQVADSEHNPQVTEVAKLGLLNFTKNGPDDPWKLEPIYSRPSAAEERLGSRN